jgi:hypothetical protein
VSRASYINYTLNPIRTGKDPVTLAEDILFSAGDWNAHWVEWTRPELSLEGQEQDQNHYIALFLWDKQQGLFYIQLKGTEAEFTAIQAMRILMTLERRESQALLRVERPESPRAGALSADTRAFLKDRFELGPQLWGIFEPSVPGAFVALQEIEATLEYTFPFLLSYGNFDAAGFGIGFDFSRRDGRTMQYTFQALKGNSAYSLKQSIVYEVLRGDYDEIFKQLAAEIAAYQAPILFRLNNEMNGDWCGYCAYYNSLDPELYEAVWKRVYGIFQAQGADNVLWVFNANNRSYPDFLWNHTLWYYPGDAYVDVVGLTAYNTGTYYPGEVWTDFETLYDAFYWDYLNWFPSKPFMISEFACSGYGGDKAAWISDMMEKISVYSRIKAMIWWNGTDWDGVIPARTYALTGEDVISAFREGLKGFARPKLVPYLLQNQSG